MAEVKRTGRQRHAGRAAAAVVGVVVAHWRPLIQWREVPLSPSQSTLPLSFPPLHPLSCVSPFLSPHGVGRGSHSLTHSHMHAHMLSHTRRHTHTHMQWLNSGHLSDRAHAGRISPSCRRSSPLWLSSLYCVCASE